MIIFNEDKLPDVRLSDTFYDPLICFKQTLSRQTDDSSGPIIALYLSYAVEAACELHKTQRVVLLCDVPIPDVEIPGLGLVGGKLDFVTALVPAGDVPPGNSFI
jgi:hypothetical protein